MSRRAFRLALAAVVLCAAALRLWHVAADLPDFLDEAVPFRKALDIWAFTGGPPEWNPHLFHYPSLTIYLHYVVQWLGYVAGRALGQYRVPADWFVSFLADPTAAVLPARVLHAVVDASAVLAAGLIGERLRRGSGLLAAALVAFAPTAIATARQIYTDTIMTALALWSLERLLAWRERGGARRLGAAVVLAGLATGAKYPAIVLLAPLAWVLFERRGARGLALWPGLAAAVLAVFLCTTPFALLDFATFRRDLGFVQTLTATGHFGNIGTAGFAYHLRNLLHDAGPAGVVLALVSPFLALAPGGGRGAAIAVWLFLLGFGLPIAVARVEAARYLVPVIPAVAVLAAAAAHALAGRLPGGARGVALALLVAALLLPVGAAGLEAAAAGGGSTQSVARRWCEAHLDRRAMILAEAYTAPLPATEARAQVEASPIFAAASEAARRRYLARPWFQVVEVPLSVVGPCTNLVQPAEGPPVEVAIFPHVADMNQIFYDPRLLAGVDYVLTSSAVRGRYAADSARYAPELRLYRLLDSTAVVLARFAARGSVAGPPIGVYRLGPRARAVLDARGPLPALWWAEPIPLEYRRRASALLGAPREGGAPRTASGSLAAWVASLAPVYDEHIRPFADAMAVNLAELERLDAARAYAEATLTILPGDGVARAVREYCDRRPPAGAEARGARP